MTNKSADAFRTISEVAEWLGVQTHVLRFWESKFSQVKPVKRAGGRRYYRPADMLLLGGIRKLLHDDGMTIKGVQKILREEGMAHVADMSPPLDEVTAAQVDGDVVVGSANAEADLTPDVDTVPEAAAALEQAEPAADETVDTAPTSADETDIEIAPVAATPDLFPDTLSADPAETAPLDPEEETPEPTEAAQPQEPDTSPQLADEDTAPSPAEDSSDDRLPGFMRSPNAPMSETSPASDESVDAEAEDVSAPSGSIPSFMTTPPAANAGEADTTDGPAGSASDTAEDTTPRPAKVDVPPDPDPADLPAHPSALSFAVDANSLTDAQKTDIAPLLDQLTALRDRMDSARQVSR